MSGEFITNGKWEKLDNNTCRLQVPGGWIVRTFESRGYNAGGCVHQIFIEDKNHIWVIEE